jgi:glycerate 2-kinase
MNADRTAPQVRKWFDAALQAVDPERAVARYLERKDDVVSIGGREIRVSGRIIVIAVGKAAAPMARAAETVLGKALTAGIALTKDGHAGNEPLRTIEVREASHPIPDSRGVAATTEMLQLLSKLNGNDLAIALISGGGSALLEAPVDGVMLDDIAAVTSLMLKAGAPIADLNAVRIPLSKVKGGGLRSATNAKFATLILSDVLGNDPRVIASGPTVPGVATGARALDLLRRYQVVDRVPENVLDALQRYQPRTFDAGNDILEIIADNQTAVDAFADAARADGARVRVAWSARQGEARDLARDWVDQLANERDADLLLGGGEATVTVHGDGEGGRNTEFALAAALELEARGMQNWLIASLATDGQDADTAAAGAIATAQTPGRARDAGVDPERALHENNSFAALRAAGGLVETGPTGTNVNDLYIAAWID